MTDWVVAEKTRSQENNEEFLEEPHPSFEKRKDVERCKPLQSSGSGLMKDLSLIFNLW